MSSCCAAAEQLPDETECPVEVGPDSLWSGSCGGPAFLVHTGTAGQVQHGYACVRCRVNGRPALRVLSVAS